MRMVRLYIFREHKGENMSTQHLKHGTPARLFPIYPEAAKEQRSLSIILATMVSVRPFAEQILTPIGVRLGKRASISAFTEVTMATEVKGLKDRPDALLTVETGKSTWSALIEAKIGKATVESEQLERYIELAKLNGIDAVITISNELSPDPAVNPTALTRSLPKSVSLFHYSWSALLTHAFLIVSSKADVFENNDEAFIVSELVRYIEHPNSGRLPMDQMSASWPKIVSDVQAAHPINAKSSETIEMISIWNQEARDVALLLTRHLKESVTLSMPRAFLNDPKGWLEGESKKFCDVPTLEFELDVPNTASRIRVVADFLRRSINCSMKLQAPGDRASNQAKLNWLLKQLAKSDKDKVVVRCITRGKGFNFGRSAAELDPKADEIKQLAEIVSFEIEMSVDLGGRFNSRKKIVESLEDLVPKFYSNVGQHLQAWQAPPPKVKNPDVNQDEIAQEPIASPRPETAAQSKIANDPINSTSEPPRPEWTHYWKINEQIRSED